MTYLEHVEQRYVGPSGEACAEGAFPPPSAAGTWGACSLPVQRVSACGVRGLCPWPASRPVESLGGSISAAS